MKQTIIVAGLAILLTACGGASGPQPTNTPVVVQQSPTTADQLPTAELTATPAATVDAGCRKQELERWIQASAQHSRALLDLLNLQVLITPAEQMGSLVGQVSSAYEQLKLVPQPVCAQSSVDLVTGLFETAITQLNSYSTGQAVDLGGLLANATATYEQIRLEDQALRQLYGTLPRE